jgi:hypothetical protein
VIRTRKGFERKELAKWKSIPTSAYHSALVENYIEGALKQLWRHPWTFSNVREIRPCTEKAPLEESS